MLYDASRADRMRNNHMTAPPVALAAVRAWPATPVFLPALVVCKNGGVGRGFFPAHEGKVWRFDSRPRELFSTFHSATPKRATARAVGFFFFP